MGMKYAITGGGGFIGRNLAKRLISEGHEVICIDNGSRHGQATDAGGAKLVVHDILARDTLEPLLRGCDSVIHCAAINGTRHFYERPWDVLQSNAIGTHSVILASIVASVREFHYVSSSEVVNGEYPAREDSPFRIADPLNPRFSYAGSKILGELLTLNAPVFTRVTVMRPFNIYGPDMGNDHVIPQLIDKMVGNDIVEIQGGGQTRCFCHIDDATDAMSRVIQQGEHRGVYNIGTTEEVTIDALARMVAKIVNPKCIIGTGPVPEGDPDRRKPDNSKIMALGWRQTITLSDGLEALFGQQAIQEAA
jgi:nucleoside-diphosphate-sugar epimerase